MNLEGKKIPQPYLVSAILVAITIFLTPGGGLLNTWEEWETEMNLDFSYWKRKKNGHQREADLRLINCRHEGVQGDDDESIWKNRRTNTTWLKIFWLTLSTSVGASSTITSHSITMAIRSIYFVQKVDSTFIYSTIVKIFNRSPPIIFYLILKILLGISISFGCISFW